MTRLFEDGVPDGVVTEDSFILRCASDCVIAISIRVFAAGRTWKILVVDREPETIEE